jgi:hypothetical protein
MKSISRKGAGNSGCGCMSRLAGTALITGGVALFYFFSFIPLSNWNDAQSWPDTPCKVLRSEVGRHASADGYTFSVDILYEYEMGGGTHTGYRYNFFDGSSSGLNEKQAVVDQYPVGEMRSCYVNPDAPEESVLNRDFSGVYLIGCFGAVLALVGLVLLLVRWDKKTESLSRGGTTQRITPQRKTALDYSGQESITLKGSRGGIFGFIFISLFAVIWNGFVYAGLGVSVYKSSFAIGTLLFFIVFAFVGLLLIVGMVYMFLSLFNPKPELTLAPSHLPLGGTATVAWSFRGDTSRIQKLTISITGTESATYRRGTKTTTDTRLFEKMILIETDEASVINQGDVAFSIPEFTAPSFEASNNKITWHIKVEGDIPKWPDVGEEFELTIAPLPTESDGATPRRAEFQAD